LMIVDCRLKRIHRKDNQITSPVHRNSMELIGNYRVNRYSFKFYRIERERLMVL